jgi:hypothetical protein
VPSQQLITGEAADFSDHTEDVFNLPQMSARHLGQDGYMFSVRPKEHNKDTLG